MTLPLEDGTDGGTHITLGASSPRRSNLLRLRKRYCEKKLVLWLGAGVSIPYGIPNWNQLVLGLLIRHGLSGDPAGRRGIHGWDDYSDYRQALGEWMIERFKFDALKLAQVFAAEGDLKQKIKDELYASLKPSVQDSTRNTSLDAVVQLIAEGQRTGNGIQAVITLNYDDLLETKLREAGIECTAVIRPNTKIDGIAVYHVHGFLPSSGSIPKQELIFTESNYYEASSSGFSWAVQTMLHYLYNYHVLFVGVSMNDPNLRRFLDVAHANGEEPRHFVIRQDYVVGDDEVELVVAQIQAKARKVAQRTGRKETEGRTELGDAILDVCRLAHEYDREALNSLGVRPIWVRDNADVSKVVEVVYKGIPGA
jgi:hypothetical protein